MLKITLFHMRPFANIVVLIRRYLIIFVTSLGRSEKKSPTSQMLATENSLRARSTIFLGAIATYRVERPLMGVLIRITERLFKPCVYTFNYRICKL